MIINYQKLQTSSLTRQRKNELFSLSLGVIVCIAILWFVVSSIFINILFTVILLLLYFVLLADIIDFNRSLRRLLNVIAEKTGHKKDGEE